MHGVHRTTRARGRRRTVAVDGPVFVPCLCLLLVANNHNQLVHCFSSSTTKRLRHRESLHDSTSSNGKGRAVATELFESSSKDNVNDGDDIINNLSPLLPPLPKKKRGRNVRLKVFSTLNLPIVEVASASAVFLSSLLVALDTLNDLPVYAYTLIDDSLLLLNLLFATEFFVRWYAAGQFKAIYLTKPLVVLDIVVVILPLLASKTVVPFLLFFLTPHNLGMMMIDPTTNDNVSAVGTSLVAFLIGLQNSAGLQNLLLLRVLRLRRVLTDINTFGKFQVALGLNKPQDIRPYQLQLARVMLTIVTLLSVASGLIYTAEHDVNPEIPDYFAALYFGLTTLTTVGFGDISPITAQGRFVVCASILAGVAIIPAQAAKLVDVLVESGKQLEQTGKQKQSVEKQRRKQRQQKQHLSTKNNAAADGKGPSGASIDASTTESARDDAGGSTTSTMDLEDNQRCCIQCGVMSHRIDASFCWSCGSEL